MPYAVCFSTVNFNIHFAKWHFWGLSFSWVSLQKVCFHVCSIDVARYATCRHSLRSTTPHLQGIPDKPSFLPYYYKYIIGGLYVFSLHTPLNALEKLIHVSIWVHLMGSIWNQQEHSHFLPTTRKTEKLKERENPTSFIDFHSWFFNGKAFLADCDACM